MKGFEYQDVGLFTFYREQAEYEEKIQSEKKEKALRKKLQRQQQKQKQVQLKNGSSIKCIGQARGTEGALQKDHLIEAKKYIKELQQSGHNKFVYNQRKRQKRYNNPLQYPQKQKLDSSLIDAVNEPNKINNQNIFVNKKDYSKLNYYISMEKQVIAPKQFNSVQIFEMKKQFGKRQLSQDNIKKKPSNEKKILEYRLPKISSSELPSRAIPNMIMPKKQPKHIKMYYNPLDIILNNQKFKLKQPLKSHQRHKSDKQLPLSSNNQIERQENSVIKIMKKYQMAKLI